MFLSHEFTPHEDHSATFAAIRGQLRDADGTPFPVVIRDLKADYPRVWRDLALGYLGLISTAAGTV